MLWKRALITVAACFGIGLGVANTAVAHACTCRWGSTWDLVLETIEGDSVDSTEKLFWQSEARIDNLDVMEVQFSMSDGSLTGVQIDLELVQ